MRNSQYVKNSINNLQEYAKSCKYKIEFTSSEIDFYFIVYKCRWFGLNNKIIRKFHGTWDGMEYNFNTVWEMVYNFIKYKYNDERRD